MTSGHRPGDSHVGPRQRSSRQQGLSAARRGFAAQAARRATRANAVPPALGTCVQWTTKSGGPQPRVPLVVRAARGARRAGADARRRRTMPSGPAGPAGGGAGSARGHHCAASTTAANAATTR